MIKKFDKLVSLVGKYDEWGPQIEERIEQMCRGPQHPGGGEARQV